MLLTRPFIPTKPAQRPDVVTTVPLAWTDGRFHWPLRSVPVKKARPKALQLIPLTFKPS